ncbi:MAG: hypothetical protein IPG01_05640 [Chitinophagaceae bacterium]|nr:hypothetical protein [Chitinophagaceae bacterium]
MKSNNDGKSQNQNKPDVTNDRKVPTEISPPMPKPERKDEDNDFTRGDENDPLRKERIDRPTISPDYEEEEDENQNSIAEPVAADQEYYESNETNNIGPGEPGSQKQQ